MAAERITSEVLALAVEERAELAHLLIMSLEQSRDADASATFDAEVERRAQEIRCGTAIEEPAEAIFESDKTIWIESER